VNNKNTDLLREISKSLQLKPLQLSHASKPSKRVSYGFGMNDFQSTTTNAETDNIPMSRSMSFSGVAATTTSTSVDLNLLSLKKPALNETSLYNIDEDKEVESSFQHVKRSSESTASTTPVNQTNPTVPSDQSAPAPPPLPPMPPAASIASIAGRFTPACFPGKSNTFGLIL
jgi:hypothetical protein